MVKTLPIYQIYLRSQILDIIFIFKEIDILAINIQPSFRSLENIYTNTPNSDTYTGIPASFFCRVAHDRILCPRSGVSVRHVHVGLHCIYEHCFKISCRTIDFNKNCN